MTERENIIESILNKRRKVDQEKNSIEEAKKLLPVFRESLLSLNRSHFPEKPDYIPMGEMENFISLLKDDEEITKFKLDNLKTKLICEMLIEDQRISTTISCSAYPRLVKAMEWATYKIDVSDLDYVLIVKQNEAILQSKEIESGMPKNIRNVVIGQRYPTWPAWEKPATREDIIKFQEFIDILAKSDANFTTEIRVREIEDYS